MTIDPNLPGVFKVEHLYTMLRSYCLALAPYPLQKITVAAVANAFMKDNSGMRFDMSEAIPPDFTGQLADTFGRYLEHDETRWPPEGSSAWFTIQFMRLKSADDINRLGNSYDAMVKWMTATGYLTETGDNGYLPTQKILDEKTLKF